MKKSYDEKNVLSRNQVRKLLHSNYYTDNGLIYLKYVDIVSVIPNPIVRFPLLKALYDEGVTVYAKGTSIDNRIYCFNQDMLEAFILEKRVYNFIPKGMDMMSLLKGFYSAYLNDRPVRCISYEELKQKYNEIELAVLIDILIALDAFDEYYEQNGKGWSLGFNINMKVVEDKLGSLNNRKLKFKDIG